MSTGSQKTNFYEWALKTSSSLNYVRNFFEFCFKETVILLIPFLLGLLAALFMLMYTMWTDILYKLDKLKILSTNDTVLFALKLVDVCLIANLLIVVALASFRQLVDADLESANPTLPKEGYPPAAQVSLQEMKHKLLGSALAIAVISLLSNVVLVDKGSEFDPVLIASKAGVIGIIALSMFLTRHK